jgi:hypothetical protein
MVSSRLELQVTMCYGDRSSAQKLQVRFRGMTCRRACRCLCIVRWRRLCSFNGYALSSVLCRVATCSSGAMSWKVLRRSPCDWSSTFLPMSSLRSGATTPPLLLLLCSLPAATPRVHSAVSLLTCRVCVCHRALVLKRHGLAPSPAEQVYLCDVSRRRSSTVLEGVGRPPLSCRAVCLRSRRMALLHRS